LKTYKANHKLHHGTNSNVYSLSLNTTRKQNLNETFGEKNLYRSTSGDEIEKLLMNLESDTSRPFSTMKKEANSSGNDVEDCSITLSARDILSIKKFFTVSALRTQFFRDHLADPHGMFQTTPFMERKETWINMLRLILEGSLETLSEWKQAERPSDDDGASNEFYEKATNAIELYQIISNMQLHIWKTTGEEEFLLGDRLVHIEGLVGETNDQSRPKAAHLLMPISPSVIVAVCNSQYCRQASMLSTYQHAEPREHTLPGRKKPGKKGYRPPRNVWIYPITKCEEHQIFIINRTVFASTRIVFRSAAAFRKAVDGVTASQHESDSRNRSNAKMCEDHCGTSQPNLADTTSWAVGLFLSLAGACTEGMDGQLREEAVEFLRCVVYATRFYTSMNSHFGCQHCDDDIMAEIKALLGSFQ
jgi:hypothetical protein